VSIATKAYLLALGITLLSEVGVVVWGYRGRAGSLWRLLAVFAGVNLFTHGLLWTLWSRLPGRYVARLLLGEGGVWLVEAGVYRGFFSGTFRRAAIVSLLANLLSTVVGLLVWRFLYAHGGLERLR
jgi:hypothetical protein